MFCKKCGKEIREGAKFCPGCGAASETAAPPPAPMPAKSAAPVKAEVRREPAAVPEKKKGKGGIIALLCVLLVLAIGVGACYVFCDALFGGKDVDEEKLEAANAQAESLYTAAQTASELVREEGCRMEEGYYLFTESYEKPDEAPELPESGAVSVSEPDYFLWLVSEEFEEIEELEGFGFYVEGEEIAAVIVEQDDCIGAYPNPVLPEDAEDLELSEEALDYAADGNAETNPEESAAEETAEETTEAETDVPTEAPTEAPLYSWYLEPEIEAEDINVVAQLVRGTNYGCYIGSDLSIVKVDGQYGVINIDGEMLADTEYMWVSAGLSNHFSMHTGEAFAEFCSANAIQIYPTDNWCEKCEDNIDPTTAYGSSYYFDLELGLLCNSDFRSSTYEYDEFWMFGQNSAGIVSLDEAVTARSVTFPEDYEQGDSCTQAGTLGNTYGVVKNNEVIVAFEYENATSYLDGVAALCKDGKWGYVNEDGEEIIPFVFDGDLIVEYEYTLGEYHNREERLPYLPSEGYIAVNNENGGGYFDTAGNEVIPVGTFEEARPVYNGLAWVKKNGLWGVISVDGEAVPEAEPAPSGAYPRIVKTYTGTYMETQGLTSLDLTILTCDEDGNLTAEFSFYENPANPGVPSGSYLMEGYVEQENADGSLEIYLTGTEWIDDSSGYRMIDINGTINDNALILSDEAQEMYLYDSRTQYASLYQPQIVKTYTGTYRGGQGETGLDFTIESCDEEGNLTGYFSFYAVSSNPDVPSGEYWMAGAVKRILPDGSIEIDMYGTEWVVHPDDYLFCDFSAVIDAQVRTLTGDSYSLSLTANE